ncbi:methyltransferase-like protein 17: mitochondrial [Dinothrombium tinctorium]|uniref:Methyltransferase-like protein 17: mitochondrial n=1 Tax=Dinothrombium tinctorium TaxID=1965070 RepID=A0A3S3S1A4_9ACAR|nr:methyltransferase-like protein 17: mitochondrial [Dinothrombium tinctorium]
MKLGSSKDNDYTEYNSVLYLATRLVPNYAATLSIFDGIKKDDPTFKPQTLFDFGSGVGTTMWAANQVWPNSLSEHFNVDASEHMNDTSRLLLQIGRERNPLLYNGVFYRQFLPVSSVVKYDLVVSAFSLLELPNSAARVHVIENLWHKTQDMLVFIEHGNISGFAAILEARNFILQKTGHDVTTTFHVKPIDTEVEDRKPENAPTSHIIAPCPHHYPCPRLFTGGSVLCNFQVPYMPLNYGQEKIEIMKERFSYIVLRKGQEPVKEKPNWPRVVEPIRKNGGHVACKMCCADGKLHPVTFTKSKHKGEKTHIEI